MCGAVRYRFTGMPLSCNLCHCRSCRLATGTPVAAFVDLAADQFAWTRGEPAFFASSVPVRRGFCPSCGTALTYESRDLPGEMHVLSATLDDPSPFAPTEEVFAEERISWMKLRVPPDARGGGR